MPAHYASVHPSPFWSSALWPPALQLVSAGGASQCHLYRVGAPCPNGRCRVRPQQLSGDSGSGVQAAAAASGVSSLLGARCALNVRWPVLDALFMFSCLAGGWWAHACPPTAPQLEANSERSFFSPLPHHVARLPMAGCPCSTLSQAREAFQRHSSLLQAKVSAKLPAQRWQAACMYFQRRQAELLPRRPHGIPSLPRLSLAPPRARECKGGLS